MYHLITWLFAELCEKLEEIIFSIEIDNLKNRTYLVAIYCLGIAYHNIDDMNLHSK